MGLKLVDVGDLRVGRRNDELIFIQHFQLTATAGADLLRLPEWNAKCGAAVIEQISTTVAESGLETADRIADHVFSEASFMIGATD